MSDASEWIETGQERLFDDKIVYSASYRREFSALSITYYQWLATLSYRLDGKIDWDRFYGEFEGRGPTYVYFDVDVAQAIEFYNALESSDASAGGRWIWANLRGWNQQGERSLGYHEVPYGVTGFSGLAPRRANMTSDELQERSFGSLKSLPSGYAKPLGVYAWRRKRFEKGNFHK